MIPCNNYFEDFYSLTALRSQVTGTLSIGYKLKGYLVLVEVSVSALLTFRSVFITLRLFRL